MSTRIAQIIEHLRTSLWLVPAVCTLLAGILAFVLVEFDARVGAQTGGLPWSFVGGAESARNVLSTIAGSMITVAGTVYSITIVVLTLASVQFAPRVLGSFMRDRTNQVVLGFFVATFAYCLLVLRSVRSTDEGVFVPHTAVTGGVVLALISLGMLIYFIDHIFHAIQVSNIIANVSHQTVEQIRHLYPKTWSEGQRAPQAAPDLSGDWAPVMATHSGYLQFVDYESLLHLATHEGIVVRQDRSVGAFIIAGAPLAFVTPSGKLTPALQTHINGTFALGTNPTLQQDVGYGVRQLVDIALKAISPAVNDPTTAANCIDHLGLILLTLANRELPDWDRYDAGGELRIIVHERTFHDLVRLAFDQIRHYGARDHVILLRMLDTLARIGAATRNPVHCANLSEYIEKIAAAAEREIVDPAEIASVRERAEEARHAVRTKEARVA